MVFFHILDAAQGIKKKTIIDNGYSKDKNHVYFESKILKEADVNSFTIIPHEESLDGFHFAKDDKHIFYLDKAIPVADLATF